MDYEERTSTHTDLQEIHFHRTLSTSVPPRVSRAISFFSSNVGRASPFIFRWIFLFSHERRNNQIGIVRSREGWNVVSKRHHFFVAAYQNDRRHFFVDEYREYRVLFIYESSLSETLSDRGISCVSIEEVSSDETFRVGIFLLGFSRIGWLEFPCHSPMWKYISNRY